MRLRLILPVMLASVFVLGACGSSGSPSGTPGTTTGKTTVTYQPAGAFPSKSAKMICQKEAEVEIASALGVHATRVTKPTWRDHVYSCTYVYPEGTVVLSVKELVDDKSTTDYFNAYKTKLGLMQNLFGLGQGAFIAKNNDVVVRKDYKVLLVDVQHVPQTFIPAMTRQDVATNIASVVMSCWVGA